MKAMKKWCTAVIALGAILFLAGQQSLSAQPTAPKKEVVEVLYFHGKQRCVTCNAIEKLTKEVIDQHFAKEIKSGKLVFRTIDISKDENEKIAEKYEVNWSSLFVNQWRGGKEKVNNMTEFGFMNAKNAPSKFKDGIKKKIQELLK